MKVLFLDHYGVMSLSKLPIERTIDSLPSIEELNQCKPFDDFDPECVRILNSIIRETNLEIVVSSDWMNQCSLDEICKFYKLQGIIKKPVSYISKGKGKTIQEKRKNGILNWIYENKVSKYVCVDDIYLDIDNFVWCKFPNQGLKQEGIKDFILNLLK